MIGVSFGYMCGDKLYEAEERLFEARDFWIEKNKDSNKIYIHADFDDIGRATKDIGTFGTNGTFRLHIFQIPEKENNEKE